MKGKELVKLLKKDGWELDRINGSHHVMKKDGRTEIIPVHNKDIPIGLANAIMKRTGLK
ncbi:MAG: type II toxin-antitoxin system HicA family toxin [Eubacteriales bacterium]